MNYKSRIRILAICFMLSSLSVFLLYWRNESLTNRGSGFLRKFPSHQLIGTGFIKLKEKRWYFAGNDNAYCYLSNWSMPKLSMRLDYEHRDTLIRKITGLNVLKVYPGAYFRSNGNSLFLCDGRQHLIAIGNNKEGKLYDTMVAPGFDAAIPLMDGSFIFRTVNRKRENVLIRYKHNRIIGNYVLKGDGDGVFSTDGTLFTDPESTSVFYSYYYSNRFFRLSPELKLIYQGKTIDTNSHAVVKTVVIRSTKQRTLAGPTKFVNERATANDRWLFIHSAVKADNEISKVSEKISVIDVYDVKNGAYKLSFYPPDLKGERMRDFRVYKNTMVMLYDHYLYFCKLLFLSEGIDKSTSKIIK